MPPLRQPKPGSMSRTTLTLISGALAITGLGVFGHLGHSLFQGYTTLGGILLTAPHTKPGEDRSTWGRTLNATTATDAALKCTINTKCSEWINANINTQVNIEPYMYLMMGLFTAGLMVRSRIPSDLIVKDPGQGAWAGINDHGIYDIVSVPIKDRRVRKQENWLNSWSPKSFYLGHMMPWAEQDGFDWTHPRLAFLRERRRHENVMISGAPGSGKTRGIFRQNIILDAEMGNTAIVFDLKWPQMDSGFKDLILYWHRRNRPVYVFAPFSANSMRLPLLAGIDSLDEALKLAKTILPAPENQEEVGKHYKDLERRALASMILAIAQSPTPTMKELQRLGQMTVAEFENWYRLQANPEIKANLRNIFQMDVKTIAGTLAGVVNILQVFNNENVSRATTAGSNPSETIPLEKALAEGSLILIGIETKHTQEGQGEILIQLTKRLIDRAILNLADRSKGARVPVTVTYYLDELDGLGRLPYLKNNLAQLRSRGVALVLGIQNSDQGTVTYNRDYWRAVQTNNIGTRIEFIQGMSKDDAKSLSEEVGETTVYARTTSRSNHGLFGNAFSAESRKGESIKLEKVRLLSLEEIKRSPPDLAVVFAKGQNPALVASVAIDAPTLLLRTPDGQHYTVKNKLHFLWKRTMKGINRDNIEEETNAVMRGLTVQRTSAKHEVVQAAPDYWQDWLGALLDDGAMCRRAYNEDKVKIMIRRDTLSERLNKQRDIDYFIGCSWLSLSDSEEELTITQEGLNQAGKVLRNSLTDFIICGPALYWLREHQSVARHSPESLTVTLAQVKEIYNIVPDLPRTTIDGTEHVVIPLSDPRALSEAIARAERKATEDSAVVDFPTAREAAPNGSRKTSPGKTNLSKTAPPRGSAEKKGKEHPTATESLPTDLTQTLRAAQSRAPVARTPESEDEAQRAAEEAQDRENEARMAHEDTSRDDHDLHHLEDPRDLDPGRVDTLHGQDMDGEHL